MKPLKLAHSEGHTDVCYGSSGSYILTGGNDGKVCIWEDQDDTDTTTVNLGGTIFALAFHGERIFAATDENAIRIHTFPDGVSDGMVTRFTAPCRHFCICDDGSMLVAGSDDFKIKVISMEENECICLYSEHQAPVLSIALDPTKEFIASSSCDGSVHIWNVIDGSVEKVLNILPKYSEPSQAKSLCRICWSKNGEFLLIPLNNEIVVYLRSSWEVVKKVNNPSITEVINVMMMCPDGNHVAVGCVNGDIGVFDWQINRLIEKYSHPKHLTISSLAWNPRKLSDLAFTDNMGMLGFLDIAALNQQGPPKQLLNGSSAFEDMDDDDDAVNARDGERTDRDDIDAFLDGDDDNSIDIGSIKRSLQPLLDLDDGDSMASDKTGVEKPGPQVVPVMALPENLFKPTPLQPPFQPGSTPDHLSSRFMIWNSVGVVRQYVSEDENSIDVEFHDTATHHTLHIDNKFDYVMADLSAMALLLASRSDQDTPSKLLCMHFGSWDSHKEWSYDMPDGEDIQAITVTEKWAAVATATRSIRIFSIGGLQCQVFSLPGNVVTLTSHENKLLSVYHKGMGIPGDQFMGLNVMAVKGNTKSSIINGDTLPLSPAARLAWIGFSEEGSPFLMDSTGIVRMLNKHFSRTWFPVANTRKHVKGKSDHYWLVGVSERQQQIRCVPCKGSRYPATLPRPALAVLPFQLPLCDMSSEKTQHEESYQRNWLINKSLQRSGLVDEDELTQPIRESLIKLFAFAAKSEKDFRALEVCEMMEDQSLLHIAATYATRLKRIQLAERVSEFMQRCQEEAEVTKDEEHVESEEEECDEADTSAFRPMGQNAETDERNHVSTGNRLRNGEEDFRSSSGPLLKTSAEAKVKPIGKPSFTPNPFKRSGPTENNPTKGSHVFDKMEKTVKASPVFAPLPVSIKKSNKKQTGNQSKLLSFTKEGKKPEEDKTDLPAQENLDSVKHEALSQTSVEDRSNNEAKKKKVSPFDLWLEASKQDLQEEHPDQSEEDLSQTATVAFRSLSKEERQTWVQKAKSLNELCDSTAAKKRRLFNDDSDRWSNGTGEESKKQKVSDISSERKTLLTQSSNAKLARFAKSD